MQHFNLLKLIKKTLFTLLHGAGWPITQIIFGILQIFLTAIQIIQQLFRLFRGIFNANKFSPSIRIKSRKLTSKIATVIVRLIIAFTVSTLSLTLATIIGLYLYFQTLEIPDHYKLKEFQPPQTSQLFDRNGQLLYSVYKDQDRSTIQLDQLPVHLVQAHLAIEDDDFYSHHGLSLPDITRAAINNFQLATCQHTKHISCPPSLQGASTITQQLIKNTLLTSERTWNRKLIEAYLAIQVERTFTKDQILEMYLNQIPYGSTAYGIEAASQQYFNKPATKLNLAEAALLAGLPAAPSNYSPFGSSPDKAYHRQQIVLSRMLEEQYITWMQYQDAISAPIQLATPSTDIKAPHFVMYTRELLEQKLGPEALYQGGLQITTSLDLELQQFAEQVLREELDHLKNLNVSNGAILITKPATGEILTMIGSRNYFDTPHQGNVNATLALRQPGSSIKPVTYATALNLSIPSNFNEPSLYKFSPATIIKDQPIVYKIPGTSDYRPRNYDGKFHGSVTLREALANSYNIPAVKVLNIIGLPNLLSTADELGITTWSEPSRFGLALTLGAGEVRMTDMVTVYGTFANLGHRQDLTPIQNIETASDHLPVLNAPPSPFTNSQPELDPRVAYIINHILSDNQARSASFGTHSKLNIPGHTVAVKTGTTNDLRDNWIFGYTPDYLVAVWVGNFDNSPMSRIASGVTGATSIWNTIMTHLLTKYHPEQVGGQLATWTPPAGIVERSICTYTGTLSCQKCPSKNEIFIEGTEPLNHCHPDYFAHPNPTPEPNT